jgi:hypothetical protein
MKPDTGSGFKQRKAKSVYRGRQETIFSRLNRIPVMAPILGPILGSFFKGVYLPKKLTPKSSIETEH